MKNKDFSDKKIKMCDENLKKPLKLQSEVGIRDSNRDDPDQIPFSIPKLGIGIGIGIEFEKFGIWD